MKLLPKTFPKKISWSILCFFFIFDNVISYYAVTRLHANEMNLVLAPLVEKWPLVYFLCIPAEIFIMYLIVKGIKRASVKILKRKTAEDRANLEKIALVAVVIYWAIANSSINVSFLLGHRLTPGAWLITSFAGLLAATIYSINKYR